MKQNPDAVQSLAREEVSATPRPWKISGYRPFSLISRDPNESTYKIGDDKFTPVVHFSGNLQIQKSNANLIISAVNSFDEAKTLIRWMADNAPIPISDRAYKWLDQLARNAPLISSDNSQPQASGEEKEPNDFTSILTSPIFEQRTESSAKLLQEQRFNSEENETNE